MKTKHHEPKKAHKPIADEDTLPMGMQKTREVKVRDIEKDEESGTFSPMESGGVDDLIADIDAPAGGQGGRGPLKQEGEGNRQDAEAAELEQIEPDLEERMK